jgi:hypothetical protein
MLGLSPFGSHVNIPRSYQGPMAVRRAGVERAEYAQDPIGAVRGGPVRKRGHADRWYRYSGRSPARALLHRTHDRTDERPRWRSAIAPSGRLLHPQSHLTDDGPSDRSNGRVAVAPAVGSDF